MRTARIRRTVSSLALTLAALLTFSACAGDSHGSTPTSSPPPSQPSPAASPAQSVAPSPVSTPTPAPEPTPSADPRWVFFTADPTLYASPWFDGRHRMMIGFGCTVAPYYRSDSRCPGAQGFHHGIDIAIPCGEVLRTAAAGRVVVGGLGTAYGEKAFRIRTDDHDLIVGHAQELLVSDGERVMPGQVIAEVGALGAPDGCHLHLEQRAVGGGLTTATDPAEILALTP